MSPTTAACLTRATVDLDIDLFAHSVLLFNDPALALTNGADFGAGVAVAVAAGVPGALLQLFEGEVVALEPQFRRDLPTSLAVVCLDPLHRLALASMTRALNNADRAEALAQVARSHGLSSEAEGGTKEHIFQQNTSDAVFLRRLAQQQGQHLRIEGKKLVLADPPETSECTIRPTDGVRRLKVKLKAAPQVSEVAVHGYDPATKQGIVGRVKGSSDGSQKHGAGAVLSIAGHESQPSDTATAEQMAKGRLRKLAEGFSSVQVDKVGDPAIRPGAQVVLEKFGPRIDGRWRVETASHVFDRFGYSVRFRGVRIADKKPGGRTAAKAREQRDAAEVRDREQSALAGAETFPIEITLVDAAGAPVEGMGYDLLLSDGRKLSGFTDASGLLRATSKKPGDARFQIFPERKRPQPAPGPGPKPTPAPEGLELEVTLVGADDQPRAKVPWELTLPDGRVLSGVTADDGVVRARSPKAGDAKLEILSKPRPTPTPTGALAVELKLVDAQGAPLEGVAWELDLPDGRTVKGRSAADGAVRARSSKPGDFELRIPEEDGKDT